jgi:Tol biopolymer transport system component
MSKRIWLCGIVLLVAASSAVCLGQESEQSTFRAILGFGQEAKPSAGEADEPIDELREKLTEQLRSSSQALQLLDEVKRQLAREKAKMPTEGATRKGEDGFRAIYTIDPEGSKAEYLTAAPGMISSSSPEFSRDGTMIAFDAVARHNALSEAHLFVCALEGPFKGTFKDLGCGNVPTWSPDDKRIAYMLNPGNPCGVEWGIWIMNADGSQRKRLCDGWYPRFSPDGKLLHVYAPTSSSIHVIRPDGQGERKLVGRTMRVKYGGGTWSPEGNRIVFIGTRDGTEQLATVAVDDEDERSVRVLYTEEDKDRELVGPPAWSPDGRWIVLAIYDKADSSGSSRRWHDTYLYKILAEVPSEPAILEPAKTGWVNRSPMWSPDGKTIVFSSER